ncbi:ADP-ribosylation factor-like protein 2 [Tulasnella sp. 330]|nr:ADP-ribosylation factor-like protein 2 [Tulasnella sp. 330]KAG8883168.1 ADP-ribosylation factor-like protein 2 [Tulasnella sp. 331]KAG8888472.1 ADP-ribosylation factor-like protein 2 [Tulasnella sp. 332]
MGLLTVIRKQRQKEREMRILFLGLDNAGKTTIIKRLNGDDITTVSPTLGFEIKTFLHGKYTLNIWDVGGQRVLRPYWRNYFEQTDAIVWVVDSSDRLRMDDCKTELHSLLQENRLAGASLLVFANKQDLHGAMNADEIRDALSLTALTTHQWKILSCSAVLGTNVVVGVDWVVSEVAGRLYYGSLDAVSASASTSAIETIQGIST